MKENEVVYHGMGVLIDLMCGNEESDEAMRAAVGKRITSVALDGGSNKLRFVFHDGSQLVLFDAGQSCCEDRFMRTDDDLSAYIGATFLEVTVKDALNEECLYGDHEVAFLNIRTDLGTFTLSNHNVHNGYYGGFSIRASAK